jgi:4,4'-diaponeurosporenoate glycosyltransferase
LAAVPPVSLALFLAGWACGWLLLARLPVPPLPAPGSSRRRLAVVIPARDEAPTVARAVRAAAAGLRPGDELVVVDDHSTDGTAALALAVGARVVAAPDLPEGWAGKPWACSVGAAATAAEVLVFIDADTEIAAGALDRLDSAQSRSGALVSVQPWHRIERPYEALSLLFNITALMGGGAFSIGRGHFRPRLAYGPVVVVDRARYDASGGHAHPSVRGAVAEDIALARLLGASLPFAGRKLATFRMYPGGLRPLLQGWTKNIATGAASVPWWAGLLVAGWIWSLAGGPIASWWFYTASVVQLVAQGRRVGRFGVVSAVLYPLLLAFFLVVFLRSVLLTILARPVRWRGRAVPSRIRR